MVLQFALLMLSFVTVSSIQPVFRNAPNSHGIRVRRYDPMIDMKSEEFLLKYFKYKWIAKCYKKGQCHNGKFKRYTNTKETIIIFCLLLF